MKRLYIIHIIWLLTVIPTAQALELSDEPLFTFGRGVITHLDYSPDSKYLAVASPYSIEILETDGYTLVSSWDAESYEVVFSPDGKTLASRSDSDLELFDVSSGIRTRLTDAPSPGMAFRADGRLMAWFDNGNELQIWNIETEELEERNSYDMGGSFFRYSPNREYVAASLGWDDTAKVLHIPSGKIQVASGQVRTTSIDSVAISDEFFFALGTSSPTTIEFYNLVLWDSEEITLLEIYETYHIAITPDGRYLAIHDAARGTPTIFLLDMETGRSRKLVGPGTSGIINNYQFYITYSPDGRHLALSLGDRLLYWDMDQLNDFGETMAIEVAAMEEHLMSIYGVSFSRDGRLLAASGVAGVYYIWDIQTGVLTHKSALSAWGFRVQMSADGKKVILGNGSTKIHIVDLESANVERSQDFGYHSSYLSMSLSPDGKILAAGLEVYGVAGQDAVYLWDMETLKLRSKLMHGSGPGAVAFHPDGQWLATGDAGTTVKIWDWRNGLVAFPLRAHTGKIHSLSFSGDGKNMLSSGSDGLAIMWDTQTWSEIDRMSFNGSKAIINPQGNLIALANNDGSVRLVEGGWTVDHNWSHRGNVNTIEFSPDGSLLATGSEDGTVKLWAIPTEGEEPPLVDYESPVADFSGTPTSGASPLTVRFTDLSQNSPTSWLWNFGDDETSSLQNPTHTYTSPGDYTVSLTVMNPAGSDTETKENHIHVDEAPQAILSILTPTDSQILPAGTTSTTLTVSMDNHTGHWHWKLGEPFPISGSAGGNSVETGKVAPITGLQDGQIYAVYVTLVDEDDSMLTPAVTASVMFSVASPPQSAEFAISALQSEVTANAGESAAYVIMLEGENGFSGEIELFDSELPGNVEAEFDPKKVTLSHEDTLATSQLTLTIPADTVPGEHPFTVIAIPDTGETKQLELTLKIESVALVVTILTLILQPTEASFMGEVIALGQLTALSDDPIKLDDTVIQIIFTAPSGKTHTYEAKTDAEGSYQLPAPFTPDEVGEWSVKAQFEGNEKLKASERERSLTVGKGQSEIVFDTGTIGALGTEIMFVGRLEPQLEDQLISLKILRPDGSASTLAGITTEALGVFRYPLELDMAGDWTITATWPGNDNYDAVTRMLMISVSAEMGKVIMVLGGGNSQDNPAWTTFNRVAEYVYRVFLRRNFHADDDIYFLSPDPKATEGADHETSITELELAITNWAAERVNAHVPLYIYLLSHNLGDKFLLEKRGNQETYLTPAKLDEWLDQLPDDAPVTIITEACYSGNFIRTSDDKPTALVGLGRIIITSARSDRQAKILPNRSSFSKIFFDGIGANKTIGEAFNEAELLMERLPFHRDQYPQMDADGDGRINTPQDYAQVAHLYLPADMVSLAHPPDIIGITPSQTLPEGVSSLSIYAELLGVDISRVFATVIPPDFDPDEWVSDWSDLSFPELDLVEVSLESNVYEYAATYSDFTIPGGYTVIISAENPDGSAEPVQTTITVSGGIKGDVDNDGVISPNDAILTLQIVVGLTEPTGYQTWSADVNGDGSVGPDDAILILRMVIGSAAPGMDIPATNNSQIAVTLGEAQGAAGERMTVPLKVDGVAGLAGGDVCISYDPSALCAVDVSSAPGILSAINITEPGMVRIAFAVAGGLSGRTLAEIQFDMLSNDFPPPVVEMVKLYNRNGDALISGIVNGKSWLTPPEGSALLQNFPNPFNPETWIPYQLTKDSHVIIRIYTSTGQLVRTLDLGHRQPGFYVHRERAAHWDGRNDAGEYTASGVYFYSIKAGDFTAIRKMAITE